MVLSFIKNDDQKRIIDMRSDTVTKPTEEMRDAMRNAIVGDDIFGDDPTVKALEEMAASDFARESALFVPSGTMGNLICAINHCRGVSFPEMIVGNMQHTYKYEVGSMARLGGIHSWVLPNQEDGTLNVNEIHKAIRTVDQHFPVTRLISLENTHNSCGGIPLSLDYVKRVGAIAKSNNIRLHVDGARIFNASTALGVPVSELCAPADSVSFCLSKGLGAPAGSLIVGSRPFIEESRVIRKALGGGMRQVGMLAAAGVIALRAMSKRLADDHELAKTLATNLHHTIDEISVDLSKLHTNIFFFNVQDDRAEELVATLQNEHGILVDTYASDLVRVVTHHQVRESDANYILQAFKSAVKTVFQKK